MNGGKNKGSIMRVFRSPTANSRVVRKPKNTQGYTIVEVMIFLAISGTMFLIAAVFISGKQASAQFTTGINEFASQLQATIQEANDGQYPSLASLSCTSNGSTTVTVQSDTSTTHDQGSNGDCVYIGKIVHIGLHGSTGHRYEIVPVADTRLYNGNVSTGIILPTLVYNTSDADIQSLTDVRTIPQGLSVSAMKIVGATGTAHYNRFAFAILSKPANASLSTGSQTFSLYYVEGIDNGADEGTLKTASETRPASSAILLAKSVAICFDDGTNRQAAVTVGSNSGDLNVTVNRANGVAPCLP